jgi:hypothetical protein
VTIVWKPSPEVVERANVTRLMRAHGIATEEELIERSTSDVEWFWDAAIRDLGLEFFEPYTSILDTSRGVEWATWFGEGSVNLAHNCVDRWAERTPDATAIAWEGEEGTTRRVSYRELREASDRLANGLAALGVRSLDAVGIFLPPTPEAVVAVMACSKLGAVWLPLFSGFGADAVAKRLEDAEATVLITADGFPRRGKVVPMKETADEAVAAGASIRHVIVVDRLGRTDAPWDPGRDIRWDELLASTRTGSRPLTWIPNTRCSSRTRAGPPARRRAPSTSTAGSSSRSPRRSRTRPTSDPAICCSGSPTSAGSWDRGRSSARRRSARRCSCTTARRTTRDPTGSGRWWSDTASRTSGSPPRWCAR